MAISFPLDLPTAGAIRRAARRLVPQQARSPTRGGFPQSIDLGVPLWRIEYETTHLTADAFGIWDSFINLVLAGGGGYFKAEQPRLAYPIGRPAGYDGTVKAGTADPFLGSGTIDNVDLSLSRVRLTGLPNTAAFSPGLKQGDVVSIAHTTAGRGLYQVAADVTSDSGGLCTLLDLRPAPTARVANGAAYTIVRPWFEAQIDDKSIQVRDETGLRSFAFTAWQIIR